MFENFCSGCGNEVNAEGNIVHSQGCPRAKAMNVEKEAADAWVRREPLKREHVFGPELTPSELSRNEQARIRKEREAARKPYEPGAYTGTVRFTSERNEWFCPQCDKALVNVAGEIQPCEKCFPDAPYSVLGVPKVLHATVGTHGSLSQPVWRQPLPLTRAEVEAEINRQDGISPEQDFAELKPDAWARAVKSDSVSLSLKVSHYNIQTRYDLINTVQVRCEVCKAYTLIDRWGFEDKASEWMELHSKDVHGNAAKHDEYKPRYDLIPPDALDAVAEVLKYGAVKYGDRNWEKGLAWHRLYRAALGHMFAFWSGEYFDQESKLPHIWHAACCILMLVSTVKRFKDLDDRPRTTASDPNSDTANDTMPGSQQEQRVDAGTQTG